MNTPVWRSGMACILKCASVHNKMMMCEEMLFAYVLNGFDVLVRVRID